MLLIYDGQWSSSRFKLEDECLFNISLSYLLQSDNDLSFSLSQVFLKPFFSNKLLTLRTESIHWYCFLHTKMVIVINRNDIEENRITFLPLFIIYALKFLVNTSQSWLVDCRYASSETVKLGGPHFKSLTASSCMWARAYERFTRYS